MPACSFQFGRTSDLPPARPALRTHDLARKRRDLDIISVVHRDYAKQINRIERAFGDFPIKALDDPQARAVFLEWRDELAQSSLRQADYTYQTLARILSWALKRVPAKSPVT
jgi:hypothetical protein